MSAEDVLVIGAGPAGLAAAMQLRRHGLEPVLFECSVAGGLLHNANLVENYPGFPAGIPGPELVSLFLSQSEAWGVEITADRVIGLDYRDGLFLATTGSGTVRSRAVVVATGTKPRQIRDFPVPEEIREKVLYEIRTILHEEGKRIVILGGGDAAFDYAINLSKKNRVTILNRGKKTRCLPLLLRRAAQIPDIRYLPETSACGLTAGDGELVVVCRGAGGAETLEADFLVAAIGRDPNADFIAPGLSDLSLGLQKLGLMHWAGDVTNGICRQTAIAVGDGIKAAMRIQKALRS